MQAQDRLAAFENRAAVFTAKELLSNDSDADGDALTNSHAMERPIRYLTGTQFYVNRKYGGYALPDAGKTLSGGYTLMIYVAMGRLLLKRLFEN